MKKILCFISDEMADFEVTLALQILRNIGHREIITVGYAKTPVVSQAGARVVRDEHVITAKGSAFVDFAFAIADYLDIYAGIPDQKEKFYDEIVGRLPS